MSLERRAVPGLTSRQIATVTLLVLGALAFGLVIAMNRIVTTAGVPYAAYIFWQALIGGALLLAVTLLRGRPPPLDRAHLRLYLLTGLSGLSLSYMAMAFVAPKLPAGIVALELTIVPMIVYGVSLLLRTDRFHWLRAFGMILGTAGVLLIVLPETSLPEPGMAKWAVLCLAAPALFGLSIIAGERYRPRQSDPVAVASGVMLAGAAATLPFMAITGEWWAFPSPFATGHWALLAVAGLIAIAWLVMFLVLPAGGAVFYSTVGYLETLAGVGWGMLLFGERHSPYVWGALVLLFAGIYCVNRRSRLFEPAPGR